MGEGSRLVLSVNYQSDFLENKKALLDENGILRLRLRLNIYKDLPPPLLKHVGTNGAGANDNSGQPPAKRKRYEYESGAPDLTCLLGSMVNFWKNRENDGNISIRCGNKTFKAHKFILTCNFFSPTIAFFRFISFLKKSVYHKYFFLRSQWSF